MQRIDNQFKKALERLIMISGLIEDEQENCRITHATIKQFLMPTIKKVVKKPAQDDMNVTINAPV